MRDKNAKTTEADMQRMFAYLDKLGIEYTVDNNPSPEKIEMIQKSIASREAYTKTMQDIFKQNN